jgi:hypothetical protein
MNKELEIVRDYLNKIRQENSPDLDLIENRRKNMRLKNFDREEQVRKIESENIEKFNELGIIDLFRGIAEEKLVIQDDSLKRLSGITKAEFKMGRHFKKISLLFDNYRGNQLSPFELGNRITISLPFNNGINIHGFSFGEKIFRERLSFENKNLPQIKEEIALNVARFIGGLQAYSKNDEKRENLNDL